jgi:hypothetical protein
MRMTSSVLVGGFVVTMMLVTLGCGSAKQAEQSLSNVSGKVLLSHGRPLTGGRIFLRPEGGIRRGIAAEISEDGSFTLESSEGDAPVLPGKYEVYVVFGNDPGDQKLRRKVPRKYQKISDADTDLFVQINGDDDDLMVKLGKS